MTRIVYNENGRFDVESKFLWWWDVKTAMDDYGNDLPCSLTGFYSLEEAIEDCQDSEYYLHISSLDNYVNTVSNYENQEEYRIYTLAGGFSIAINDGIVYNNYTYFTLALEIFKRVTTNRFGSLKTTYHYDELLVHKVKGAKLKLPIYFWKEDIKHQIDMEFDFNNQMVKIKTKVL